MSISSILIIVIIIIIIIYIISYFYFNISILVNNVSDATISNVISSSSLTTPTTGSTAANFTYSIWIYITDWSYNYGQEKIIFVRPGVGEIDTSTITSSTPYLYPNPLVKLGATENNLIISQEVYNTTTTGTSTIPTSTFTCGVSNIPIQKWVNILVSIYGRSMDLYLDGKLVRTCVMPGIAKVASITPVYITPNGGFSGYYSKFEYFPNSTDPQTAWNIYSKGYTNNWSLFSSDYSINISVYNGTTLENSVTI